MTLARAWGTAGPVGRALRALALITGGEHGLGLLSQSLTVLGGSPWRLEQARERRVARMAAEGMTNREIAQALFVTMRTVEVHLTHAYQKLGISSREKLPAALG